MLRNWRTLFQSRLNRSRRSLVRRKSRQSTAQAERLEERCLLSSISVIATDPMATEGSSTGTLVFSRDGDLSQALNLTYSTGGSATSGVDYAALSGNVTIPSGGAAASVVVRPLEDGAADGTEALTVSLNTPAGHTVDLGTATIEIRDAFSGGGDGAIVPVSETFELHSLPNARHRVFLDFNGGTISDNGTKTIQPYNSDGSSGFSDAEKAEIQQIWSYIAEDLRPWQVDVTTEQPDIEQLRNTGGGDLEWGLRVTIGENQSNLTAPGRSGVGIFDSSSDTNNWGVRQGKPEDTAGLLTHEIGHALGLNHDGDSGDEYYDGHGSGETAWGTYMGSAYQAIVQWDRGQYPGANNQEDDLNIIATTNGFDLRPDDHGNSASTATSLVDLGNGVLLGEGIIETNTDFDLFSFTATSGPTRIFIDPPANSPNIDIKAELLNASLSVVATSDVTDQLAATFDQTLTAGSTYFVRVTGTGNRTWSTGGYDDYASLGSYTVQVGGFSTVASFVPSAGQNQDPIVGTSLFSDVSLSNLTKTGVSGGTNGAATWPLNWSGSSSQNLGEYISFTATPDSGRVLDFNELSVNFGFIAANGTVAIRSSADSFGANIDGTRSLTGGTGTLTFDISSVADSDSAVEFRVYLWTGGSGWRDLNSLSLNGRTISDAPPPPTAPVANNDSVNTGVDEATTIIVLANDTDANGDVLTVSSIASQPTDGSVVVNANNTITYTPDSGFDGTDSFTYIATDGGLNSNVATVTITVNAPVTSVRFAMLGDFGDNSSAEANVAALVDAQNPDFIVTAGDNRYGSLTYQQTIGNHYSQYLPTASGGTSTDNRFFPSPGNHDHNDGGGINEYLAYFDLPGSGTNSTNSSGNERYYDIIEGPVHFFFLDSDEAIGSSSDRAAQQNWLQTQMSASTSPWQIVLLHHAPYSSGDHGSNTTMQWDYAGWGADAVLAGHDHTYERITQSGIPYFVNGLGGRSIYNFGTPIAGSEFQYNADYGAMIIDASANAMTFQFMNLAGTSFDSYTIGQPVDTTAPTAELSSPLDGGASDLDNDANEVLVNTTQATIGVELSDSTAVDDTTVTAATVSVTRNGSAITAGTDYTFGYDAANDVITLTSLGAGDFGNGTYVVTLSGGAAKIADTVGNAMASKSLTVEVDTTITPPVTVSFQNGINSYTGTQDTSLLSSSPTTNSGRNVALEIDSSSAKHTLLRFDDIFGAGSGQIPMGATIQTATLEFTGFDPGDAPSLHRMLASWSESSTWNGLGSGVQTDGVEASTTADVTFTGVTGTHSLNVTAALQAWLADPASNLGWAFLPSGSNGVDLHSSEATTIANRPKLNVTYVAGEQPTNDAPVAINDSATTNEDTSVSIAVQSNDSDPDGDALTTSVVTQPTHGTVVANANGTISYTPDDHFNGNDSFTYRVSDGSLNSNTATVNITVAPVNDAPVAVDDFFSTDFESLLNINATNGVLSNDTDADGDAMTASLASGPNNGTVTLNSDGSFSYTPESDFAGDDSFSYSVSDGSATSQGTVTITVDGPADDHGEATDSTATLITLSGGNTGSGSASGTFEITGDRDMFRIVALEGQLTIDLNGIDGLDTYLRVYDSNGVQIASNDDGGPGLSSALTMNIAAGTHYLSAGSYADSDTGDFTISVVHFADDHADAPGTDATPITLSAGDHGTGSASGTLETAGDRDVFKVLVIDGELTLSLNGIAGLDSYLRLYDSTGTQIASNDDGGPGLNSALTISVTAGTYYISAGSYSDLFTGDFTIDVEHGVELTATFQAGVDGYASSSDTFLSGDFPNQDYGGWTVNEIDLSSSGKHEHSLLQFQNIFGSGSGQIPYASEITSATLTFYVSNGGNPVSIHRMLTPWTDSATWNSFGSGIQANGVEALATADLLTSSLSTGWRDFDVTNSLTAWLANPTSNHGWALLPTGSNGVDFYSVNKVSFWVPRLSVQYVASNGDVHADSPTATATPIDLSSGSATVFGTFETAGDRDVFAVTFTETVTLTIDLGWTGSNSLVDTYLRLYDSSATQLASDDDSGSGTSSMNSRLTITLGPGTYYVSAGSSADDDSGDFELDLSVEL